MTYQQIRRADFSPLGTPGRPHFAVDGWTDEALRDLDGTDERFGLRGTAFWPVVVSDPVFDPDTQALTDEVTGLVIDKKAFRFTGTRGVRTLTADEIAARNPLPVPVVLGKVEFITLVQLAGGMTDAMLVTAHGDPNFGAFWIKFQMAAEVQRDYPTTAGALDALAASGYMPNGKDAVLAAWPMA